MYLIPEPNGDEHSPTIDLLFATSCQRQLDLLGQKLLDTNQTELKFDRWEDDSYIYLETCLPEVQGWEADISVHNGKVFIRMEK